jgi:hypothetical protein
MVNNRLTKEQRQKALQMYKDGHKCEYIGALFGIRRESASKLALRLGATPRRQPKRKQEKMTCSE